MCVCVCVCVCDLNWHKDISKTVTKLIMTSVFNTEKLIETKLKTKYVHFKI